MTKTSINPETLKHYRKQSNLSQANLAEVSRVSKKTIARIETGQSSANSNTVKRLADTLGVTPGDLFNGPGSDEKKMRHSRYGFRTLKATINENTSLAFQMVERCYGISDSKPGCSGAPFCRAPSGRQSCLAPPET